MRIFKYTGIYACIVGVVGTIFSSYMSANFDWTQSSLSDLGATSSNVNLFFMFSLLLASILGIMFLISLFKNTKFTFFLSYSLIVSFLAVIVSILVPTDVNNFLHTVFAKAFVIFFIVGLLSVSFFEKNIHINYRKMTFILCISTLIIPFVFYPLFGEVAITTFSFMCFVFVRYLLSSIILA